MHLLFGLSLWGFVVSFLFLFFYLGGGESTVAVAVVGGVSRKVTLGDVMLAGGLRS